MLQDIKIQIVHKQTYLKSPLNYEIFLLATITFYKMTKRNQFNINIFCQKRNESYRIPKIAVIAFVSVH